MTQQNQGLASYQFDPLGWFLALPPEVQAALIGCVGLFAAACVTALMAFRQYRLQRALEIKKELLLDSVRAAYQANACFGLITDPNSTSEEISKMFSGHLGKLAVAGSVADLETVGKGRDLANTLGPAFINLIAARTPFMRLAEEITRTESVRDHQHSDNARYFAMQADALAAGDNSRFQNIQHMFDFGTAKHKGLVQQREDLISQAEHKRRLLFNEVADIQGKMVQAIREYVASVRKDMRVGAWGDRQDFMAASYIDPKRVKDAVTQAFNKMDGDASVDNGKAPSDNQ